VHAIQMELAQRFYMDETAVERLPADGWKAARELLRDVFKAIVSTFEASTNSAIS
jgi:N-formylglutamate amidohydrolase